MLVLCENCEGNGAMVRSEWLYDFHLCPRRYFRGGMRLETFKVEVTAENYKKFWHGVTNPPNLIITFHYNNLPKRVNRQRRGVVLGKFTHLCLSNDNFLINTFGDYAMAYENKEAVIRQFFYEWLNLHARREFGNLRRHLVAITAEEVNNAV